MKSLSINILIIFSSLLFSNQLNAKKANIFLKSEVCDSIDSSNNIDESYNISICPRIIQTSGIDNNDYLKGVSAQFAGVVNGKLIMAGGCNFPEVLAEDGGKKRYYKDIYAADLSKQNTLKFKKIGEMPEALAYGVSIVHGNKLLCIGGNTSEKSLSSIFSISYDNELKIDSLPSLPVAIDNMSGTMENDCIYIVGGNVNGRPSRNIYSLDLNDKDKGWILETSMPGNARVQSVCVSHNGCIYLFGGFSTKYDDNAATVSTDGLCYNIFTKEWKHIEGPKDKVGNDVSLGGGSAVSLGNGKMLCVGGVNKDIFLKALNGEYKGKDYLSKPIDWYKFNRYIFVYDIENSKWEIVGESANSARAGAALVKYGNRCYLINGEIKPGIRTSSIYELEY